MFCSNYPPNMYNFTECKNDHPYAVTEVSIEQNFSQLLVCYLIVQSVVGQCSFQSVYNVVSPLEVDAISWQQETVNIKGNNVIVTYSDCLIHIPC